MAYTTRPSEILIVDDTPANLDVLSNLLIANGYEVRAALNGQMALMAVQAAPPDLILLDINMPGMNGYEVCERLKTSEQVCQLNGNGMERQICDIPVIFVSASDETFDKVQAFRYGAVDYITKPFQVEEILARISHQLTIYYQSRELQERYTEIQRLQGIVRQYLSADAWDSIATSTSGTSTPHRRETLTILMSDVQGFTSLSEEVDPDLLLADLSLYMNMLTRVVYEHEGEVDKFLGDGMLAFFRNTRQALQAAFQIQREIETFNQQQQVKRRNPMPTRVGLATGRVLLARIGSDERKEFTLIGDRVNVAARLQSAASIGGVLMDVATYDQAGCPQVAAVAAAASINLKGKHAPEEVYAVSFEQIADGVSCEG